MKICQCCTRVADPDDEHCRWDGEQTWVLVPDPEPPKPEPEAAPADTKPTTGKAKPR